MWSTSFFRDGIDGERYAHILDFDVLRLGKKVLENNPNSGSFEFGVVVISEVGKERGNNLELREVKKTKEETNQKNDLFNSWLKMCRHSATVDNFPFVKVFTDEQRPASWGADARDLADILNIASSGRQRLALPFYTIEEMLAGKTVLVRCDFNVPMKDGVITSEKRIVEALPTVKYLLSNGAKVILCSHMGKPHNIFTEGFGLTKKEKKAVEALPESETKR